MNNTCIVSTINGRLKYESLKSDFGYSIFSTLTVLESSH